MSTPPIPNTSIPNTPETGPPRIVIIGSGFSGIGLGYYLKQAGIHDFVILEKANEVGGTWRENTYPGAECDVPSALYSYSFEHNASWQYKWAEQSQILDYLRHVANKHALYEHIRFGQEVVSADWDESAKRWQVQTAQGETLTPQFLVSAIGQLHHPATPAVPGVENFNGIAFHSAQWRHDVDLSGKRVAVIGNAASALQFIPQIAKTVSQLTVFQRSANWVLPKMDRPYSAFEQWLSDKFSLITKFYRLKIWLRGELVLYGMMRGNPLLQKLGVWMNQRYLKSKIADPALRAKLTPDYPVGAKRVLFSDDFYDAFARPNVELVTSRVANLTETGVRSAEGREFPIDVLIYGTGFKTNPFLSPMKIRGVEGKLLSENWQQGAHAYLGMTTAGFPNLFMMYGPNTNLGHNSIVIMSEAQSRYIVDCVRGLDERRSAAIEVKPEIESRYNDELQMRLNRMIWAQVENSWYKDGTRITNNWAGSTFEYLRRCRRVDWASYSLRA